MGVLPQVCLFTICKPGTCGGQAPSALSLWAISPASQIRMFHKRVTGSYKFNKKLSVIAALRRLEYLWLLGQPGLYGEKPCLKKQVLGAELRKDPAQAGQVYTRLNSQLLITF